MYLLPSFESFFIEVTIHQCNLADGLQVPFMHVALRNKFLAFANQPSLASCTF